MRGLPAMGGLGRTWRRWRQRGSRHDRRAAADLVRESESFLNGRWAVELHRGGRRVPGWAWISALAHAPADVLAAWAADRESAAAARGTVDRWQLALSLLARELMTSAAGAGDHVHVAQRLVFGPLERQGVVTHDPEQLLRVSLRALRQYRQAAQARTGRRPAA
ncbi:MAG TPA: hypothetical protein VHB02_20115 [Acidimicrobiales bacterium]|nr:hypothetical protein [Acidimicrobiales bacterium]